MSLFQDIRDSAEGRELSVRWYQDQIRNLGGNTIGARQHIAEGTRENRTSVRPTFGELNLYYYRPKTAKKLPYYDTFPIVLPFKEHKNGFMGINFHYLSMGLRVKLLQKMLVYGRPVSVKEEKIRIYWDLISNIGLVKPTVRRYDRTQVKSLYLRIPLDDMLVGILLPVQRFYTGDWAYKMRKPPRSVWHDSRRRM